MSVLIKGIEMPKEGQVIVIDSIGEVWTNEWPTRGYFRNDKAKAVPIHPHGRLIDADALKVSLAFAEGTAEWAIPALRAVLMVIEEMPTIIEAEEEQE